MIGENDVICNGGVIIPPERQRSKIVKCIHDQVHCRITSTQEILRLVAWRPGYSKNVEEYVKRCKTCNKIIRQTNIHGLNNPNRDMDHAQVNGVELLLRLVDAYSSCPEILQVSKKRSPAMTQALRIILSRNGNPKMLVSENVP